MKEPTESLDGNKKKNKILLMSKLLKEVSFLVTDFLNIQRLSFSYLLKKGLISEFKKKNPILIRKKRVKIIFFPQFYQLTIPNGDASDAIINSKTYASRLYLPIQYQLYKLI